ncbi:hypothetical protein BDV95DRAFT_507298 [Massariosphaeria phaeospora]|uniref:Rhodopsin domain-containing protein n=1 Tax=Massariosphaeria phaeospora TaxID=100035 RepID=A0A7C8HYS5_9PLEO|nr:hypothetical protein BDV95DRAFT_507298 [Massariosphaeria phaeospora]
MASPAGLRVNAVVVAFTVIAGGTVFLRLLTRGVLLRNIGIEDACIWLAMSLSIGLAVMIGLQVRSGLGRHIDQLSDADMTVTLKAFWASVWIYNLSLTATKISILIQYFRIFPIQRFRMVCTVLLGFVAAFGIWTLFGSIFLCFPIEAFWDRTVTDGRCLDQQAVWFTNGGMNIAQDFAILALPIPVLRNMDILKQQKQALMVVFALGGFVCLISIVRLQALVAISDSADPTFDNPRPAALSAIEANLSIVCACLPSMRPLLSACMPSYFPETSQYTNIRTHDEEQPKHTRTASVGTQPLTSQRSSKRDYFSPGSSRAHSRNGKELETMSTHSSRPGSRSTVNSLRRNGRNLVPLQLSPFTSTTHKLPRLPEHRALMSPPELAVTQTRHVRARTAPTVSPNTPRRPPRTPRTPLFQKPLPVTPFPISTSNG